MHRPLPPRHAPRAAPSPALPLSPRRSRRRPRRGAFPSAIASAALLLALASAPTAWADPALAEGLFTVDLLFPPPMPSVVRNLGQPLTGQVPSTNRHGSGVIDLVGLIADTNSDVGTIEVTTGRNRVRSGPGDGFAEIVAAARSREVSITNNLAREVVFTLSGNYTVDLKAEAGANETAEAVADFTVLRDGDAIFTVPSGSQPPLRVVNNGALALTGGFTTADIRIAPNTRALFRLATNLRVTVTTVPEPSAVAFGAVFGLGVLGLAARARRRGPCGESAPP